MSPLIDGLAFGTYEQVARVTTAVLAATVVSGVSGASAVVPSRIRVRRPRMSTDTVGEQ